jgi:hypothetical protein
MTTAEANELAVLVGRAFPLAHPARLAICRDAFIPYDAAAVRRAVEQHRLTADHLSEAELMRMVRADAAGPPADRVKRSEAAARREAALHRRAEERERAAADRSFAATVEALRKLPVGVLEQARADVVARFVGPTRDRLAAADPFTHPILAALVYSDVRKGSRNNERQG